MKTKSRIAELSQKSRMRVAGLMSGTSVDGVDVAIIDIDNEKVSVQAFDTFPYSADVTPGYPSALRS